MSASNNISYKREINHNYLIIDSPEDASGGYECKMLSGNTIDGLLKFRVRHHEDKKEFYYEITSKQPLARILDQRKITGGEIKALLLEISGTLRRLEEFLLKEDGLLIEPEHIYVDPDCFSVFFCFVPGLASDFPSSLTALLEYLLGKVNHQDKDGVVLAYNLYHESLKENYGMQDLLYFLSDREKGVFADRGRNVSEPSYGPEPVYEREAAGRRDTPYGSKPPAEKNEKADREIADAAKVRNKENQNQNRAKIRNAPGFLGIGIKFFLSMAATEMLLWFLKGEDGLYKYGVWIFAAGSVLCVLAAFGGKIFTKKSDKENCRKSEDDKGKSLEDGQIYKIVSKEEPYKHWTDWKESDNMEESKEPETDLLADLERPSTLAVMESLSRDRESVEIPYLPFVFGKHAELADYCLSQPTVSRLHLRIDRKEGVYIATDLNSTNGTIVEGYHLQANETVSIKNGDVIYLADVGFRFLEAGK